MGSPAIGWCFTLNNYSQEEEDHIWQLDVKYLVFGHEEGENGTPHLQGYVEFNKKIRMAQAKKLLGDRVHVEKRLGTAKQASDYCKKGGKDIFEKGTMGGQGHRSDLDRVRQLALEGGMRSVTETASYQQIRTAEIFLTYNESARDFKPKVTWICGPSGAGKTRLAKEMCGEDDLYMKVGVNKWWNGYDAHENVIIDDFRPDTISFVNLLGILDRYEFRVETKGGMRQLLAKQIIITAIESPQEMYRFQQNEPLEQLLRRIDEIINLKLNNISTSNPAEENALPQEDEEALWT